MTKRKVPQKQFDRISQFALSTGIVMGSLMTPEIVTYLEDRDVPRKDIDDAFAALAKVTKGFYRDGKSDTKA